MCGNQVGNFKHTCLNIVCILCRYMENIQVSSNYVTFVRCTRNLRTWWQLSSFIFLKYVHFIFCVCYHKSHKLGIQKHIFPNEKILRFSSLKSGTCSLIFINEFFPCIWSKSYEICLQISQCCHFDMFTELCKHSLSLEHFNYHPKETQYPPAFTNIALVTTICKQTTF